MSASFVLDHRPVGRALPYEVREVHAPAIGIAHAASAIEHDDGALQLFWFEGTKEGMADIRIRSMQQRGGQWGEAFDITNGRASGTELGKGVRTVGNPLAFRHPSGEFWLIYPVVTFGGWAGASLVLKRSTDGLVWSSARQLWAAPFLNLSNLVKAPPLFLDNGTVALPAYHEMIGGFGEMLFISKDGLVIDKARMGARGLTAIQPWLVQRDARRAIAFCRDLGKRTRRIFRTETQDAGRSWSVIEALDLPNPNSPVAAIGLLQTRIGLVFNDGETDRKLLRLATSEDEGMTWRRGPILFDGRKSNETDRYLFLLKGSDGALNLFNTRYRKGWPAAIIHRRFGADIFDLPEHAHAG